MYVSFIYATVSGIKLCAFCVLQKCPKNVQKCSSNCQVKNFFSLPKCTYSFPEHSAWYRCTLIEDGRYIRNERTYYIRVRIVRIIRICPTSWIKSIQQLFYLYVSKSFPPGILFLLILIHSYSSIFHCYRSTIVYTNISRLWGFCFVCLYFEDFSNPVGAYYVSSLELGGRRRRRKGKRKSRHFRR